MDLGEILEISKILFSCLCDQCPIVKVSSGSDIQTMSCQHHLSNLRGSSFTALSAMTVRERFVPFRQQLIPVFVGYMIHDTKLKYFPMLIVNYPKVLFVPQLLIWADHRRHGLTTVQKSNKISSRTFIKTDKTLFG